ncbi:related to ELAV-like protein 2 [Sporisorium reilianum SRZ2]|uniref:Related to ELAV-like protein 2 n=1 Tax=Sporisorium reilianum (strain SRZ2) TaxID=999809 RepID=E7A1N8_SPORE|nr:related to ELAV-like protein 2 [Sporisorium reilianum SRZ2]
MMIPRSDRQFFHLQGSPTRQCRSPPPPPPPSPKSETTPGMPSPMTTANTRWANGKRIPIAKDARKPRVLAPATPWRPRISRKTPAPTLEDDHEHPSPLDRKAGVAAEPCAISPAPTSATLVAGGDRMDTARPSVLVGDAYRHADGHEPGAPKLEQSEDWRADRWRLLRSTAPGNVASAFERGQARVDTFRHDQLAFNPPPLPKLALGETSYHASARRADMGSALDMNNETNVYVNGLPKEMNDHMLYLLGSVCGVVISHKAMMDRQSGQCKGFGFLMYASSEMAKTAIEWLNSHGFAASFAQESLSARLRRMADTSSTNVYLSNLPIKMTTQQLEQLFSPYPIASLKILYDVHGESRGVGFVRLFDRAAAKLCIERLHGRVLPGTTLPLQVRFADSEAQKQLKHSVSQKHTLESLGLLHLEAPAGGGLHRAPEPARTTGELDAAVAEARHGMGTFFPARVSAPFIPVMPAMPLADARAGPGTEQSKTGLGIQMPVPAMWPPAHVGPFVLPPAPTAGVVYSGMEGQYALDRAYPVAPLFAAAWDHSKPHDGSNDAYLPVPFIPPPGLMLAPTTPEPVAADTRDDAPRTTASHTRTRHARHRTPKPRARARFADAEPAAQRAVSDPMAMLAAQARVREALGMRGRVRAAVSADNSIDDDDAPGDAAADTSLVSCNSTGSEEEEDGLSIEILIDPR